MQDANTTTAPEAEKKNYGKHLVCFVPEHIHARFKAVVAIERTSMNSVLNKMIEDFLSKKKEKQ